MMFKTMLAFLALLAVTKATLFDLFRDDEEFIERINTEEDTDGFKSAITICNENGWDYEEYQITTEDNYILSLMRIPGRVNETFHQQKPVVLLQHDLALNHISWMLNSADKAPAFNLAEQGYDVWLGNNRGCQYGLGHEVLNHYDNTDAPFFFDFTFEEMGLYDLPAEIDFILKHTGQKQLTLVGHSQGATQALIGLSMKPEYFKERVNLFVALSPVAKLDHTESRLLKLINNESFLIYNTVINTLGYYQWFQPNFLTNRVGGWFCYFIPQVCDLFIQFFVDMDTNVDNMDRIYTYFTHIPNGAGWKNFFHYGQIISSKQFQRYDHGKEENIRRYGQATPPAYPLENIKDMPIALFTGSQDELTALADVQWLEKALGPNVVYSKPYQLGHMSFLIAKDMSYFQVEVLEIIKMFAAVN